MTRPVNCWSRPPERTPDFIVDEDKGRTVVWYKIRTRWGGILHSSPSLQSLRAKLFRAFGQLKKTSGQGVGFSREPAREVRSSREASQPGQGQQQTRWNNTIKIIRARGGCFSGARTGGPIAPTTCKDHVPVVIGPAAHPMLDTASTIGQSPAPLISVEKRSGWCRCAQPNGEALSSNCS